MSIKENRMKKLLSIATLAAMVTTLVAGEVIVKGSDTMLNLTQRLAEAFSAANPDITVSVAGGGSGVGINAVVNNEVEIGNASRAIKSKEISSARANGVNPVEYAIAVDGLCVITNEKNPVKKLTITQLGDIYRGKVKNWSEVGGPNKPVSLYGRQSNSGTFVFFREMAVKGEYAQSMRQMNGNSQIVEGVKADLGGIGYVGVGYVRDGGINVIELSSDGTNYSSPLDKSAVEAGTYPLARPLFQYTNGKVKGDAKTFIEFELSPAGQKIVEEEGFFPLNKSLVEKNQGNL
jgi:phosphate transport system substrate-binding protein